MALAEAVATEEDDESDEDKPDKKPPFALPAAKTDALEALDDFRRAVRKNQWDKAFKQLEKLSGDAGAGLVRQKKSGLWIPLRVALSDDLAQLPPAGQDAYRLFHDAEAKVLWEKSQKESGTAEIATLTRLATLELITSVGDKAADRLGELLFELGDMTGAAESWQRILTYRPDSPLPRSMLLTKIAVALAQSDRWEEFENVRRQLDDRHSKETITIGGKDVVATEYVASLPSQRGAGGKEDAAGPPDLSLGDLLLGDGSEPAWQFRFVSSDVKLRPRMRRFNPWGGDGSQNLELVMPTDLIGDSLFGNWLGCDFAIDLETGKLRWRNGRFHEAAKRLQQHNGTNTDRFALGVSGGQLWLVTEDVAQPNNRQPQPQPQQGGGFRLVRRDVATGKEQFNSKQSAELKEFVPMGAPVLVGSVVYVAANKQNQPTELYVLALKNSGRLQWATHVGTFQFSQQHNPYQGQQRSTTPTLLAVGARLYVDSHAGAFVELEAGSGRIRWAYSYPSKSPERQRFWYYSVPEPVYNPSVPLANGGMLFAKGMQSSRLAALKLDGTAVAWERSVPETAIMVGADEERIYLAGEEVLALDRKSQRLAWANRLPLTTPWMRPLVTRNRYYQFTPRGVYELDKRTGDVVRLFRGADLGSSGGAVLATSKLMITVSNQAITAYPLRSTAEADTTTAGTDPQ